MTHRELRRVSIEVGAASAEEARARLLALVPEGFEEVLDSRGLELVAYVDAEGEGRLRAAFPEARSQRVAEGWEEAWRRFHRPIRIGALWVGPPWERPEPNAVPVVIDPGRAFGTGAHPTTRLCLELLLEAEPGSLVDLGCGSGVLAIAAARLGFAPVLALDTDATAVEAAWANTHANGVAVEIRRSDVLHQPLPPTDVAVANISREAVERLAFHVPAGTLLTSGYLASESPSLEGWLHRERREQDGWAADRFEPA